MDDGTKWLAGIGLTVTLFLTTSLIAAFRSLANRVSRGDKNLHDRVERVKDTYVRRDDLDGHINRLETNVKDLRKEMKENHKQVLAILRSDQ